MAGASVGVLLVSLLTLALAGDRITHLVCILTLPGLAAVRL